MQNRRLGSYKNLLVWQKSIELVLAVYELTAFYPKSEAYSLKSQSTRAAVSIPSNIAEGYGRGTDKDLRHFLILAYGSGAELETQLVIAKKISLAPSEEFLKTDSLLQEVMKMLNKFIQTTSASLAKG